MEINKVVALVALVLVTGIARSSSITVRPERRARRARRTSTSTTQTAWTLHLWRVCYTAISSANEDKTRAWIAVALVSMAATDCGFGTHEHEHNPWNLHRGARYATGAAQLGSEIIATFPDIRTAAQSVVALIFGSRYGSTTAAFVRAVNATETPVIDRLIAEWQMNLARDGWWPVPSESQYAQEFNDRERVTATVIRRLQQHDTTFQRIMNHGNET
jgi:hypothetical protein